MHLTDDAIREFIRESDAYHNRVQPQTVDLAHMMKATKIGGWLAKALLDERKDNETLRRALLESERDFGFHESEK